MNKGTTVLIEVFVDDSSVGHLETVRGKIIAEREINKKRRGQPAEKSKEYAIEISKFMPRAQGTIFWRTENGVTKI